MLRISPTIFRVEYAADSHFPSNVKTGQVSFFLLYSIKSRIKGKEKNTDEL